MPNFRHGKYYVKTPLSLRVDGEGVGVELEPFFGKRERCSELLLARDIVEPMRVLCL